MKTRNIQISQEGTERPEYSSTLHLQVFDAVMSQLNIGYHILVKGQSYI